MTALKLNANGADEIAAPVGIANHPVTTSKSAPILGDQKVDLM